MATFAVHTVQQAAAMIGVTDAYVRQLITADKIRATRLGDKIWVITDEEVQRFINRERQPGGRPRISDTPAGCDKKPHCT